MVVLSYAEKLAPVHAKTHIRLPFIIEGEHKRLRINYSYTPKALEDNGKALALIAEGLEKCGESVDNAKDYLPVVNLITLSLDSPAGYIGAAHRHINTQRHIIGAEYSDRGFIKTEIIPGEWSITLSCHYIASEEVSVAIEVECE
ncbi:MAG: hypothetical protein ACOYIQ_01690 [Christensenellales bacterium]|jgi:hypothetical protein